MVKQYSESLKGVEDGKASLSKSNIDGRPSSEKRNLKSGDHSLNQSFQKTGAIQSTFGMFRQHTMNQSILSQKASSNN